MNAYHLKIRDTSILVSCLFLVLSACQWISKPDTTQRLLLEEGYYHAVETPATSEQRYAIEFMYSVTGKECDWGGYTIQMDTSVWRLDLYKMQRLEPGKKYAVHDTFSLDHGLQSDPVVETEGYLVGTSQSTEELHAQYTLQPKLSQ